MSEQRASSTADLRFLQNLAYLVPGYRAYQDASLRRGEDSRLRARVLAAVKGLREEIHDVRDHWEDAETETRWLQRLDKSDQGLVRLSEDLRHCPSRADGFFLQPSLPNDVIDELLGADLVLLEDLEVLAESIEALPENPPRRKGMRKLLDDVEGAVVDLQSHLLQRDSVLCRFDQDNGDGPRKTGTDG